MMNREKAEKLAQREIQRIAMQAGDEFVLCSEDTIERGFGWLFFYQSKAFIDSGELKYRLAGNGPIVVEKDSGNVTIHGSVPSVEEIIAKLEICR